MDIFQAKELLRTLADGENPITGEKLPAHDSCNQVEIVRALHAVLNYISLPQDTPQKPRYENAGKPWTKEEDIALCRMFDAGKTKKELYTAFKRSPGAITARLLRLGKIQDRGE